MFFRKQPLCGANSIRARVETRIKAERTQRNKWKGLAIVCLVFVKIFIWNYQVHMLEVITWIHVYFLLLRKYIFVILRGIGRGSEEKKGRKKEKKNWWWFFVYCIIVGFQLYFKYAIKL